MNTRDDREVWDRCLYSACNWKSIDDQPEAMTGWRMVQRDEFPEVITEGSCSGSDLSISDSWPAFKTRSRSSAGIVK